MAKGKKNGDKTKAELIKELDTLRDYYSRLKEVVGRYERVVGKKDVLQSRYDAEVERDSIEALRDELSEKQKEVDLQAEELRVQNEELAVQLEEVNTRREELERVNSALEESEERFRTLAETTTAGIVLFRGDQLLYVNRSVEEKLGYSKDELFSMNFWNVVHPDYRGLLWSRAQAQLQGIPVPAKSELKVITKGGGVLYGEYTTATIVYNGQPTVMVTIFDITERKRAEEELRESHVLLDAITSYTSDHIYVKDRLGRFIFVNPAVVNLFGVTREAMIGRPFREFTDDAAAMATVMENDRRVMESGGTEVFEEVVRTPNGTVTFLSTKTPYRNDKGEVVGIVGISRDITERKRAEEALKLTQASIDGAAEMIAWFAPNGKVHYVNNAACRALGYSRDELLQMTALDISPGFTQEQYERHWQEVRKQKSLIIQIPHRRKDGSEYPAEVLENYIQYGGQEFIFAYARDITERKRAERALMDAKTQAELYLDLMGHDINNMHQIALGYLELAQGMPPGVQMDEMIGKSIEVLQRSTQLIQNVRKLQKLNKDFLQMHEVDVGGVLHAVRREFGAVPGKNVTLNLKGERYCFVRANELLHDVFANLVGNAIKHTGDKADINIDLDIVNDNGCEYCRVSVEDDGPGIPDDFKGVIFNRVLKGTQKAKGMGIGLYLVKSLVDSYGGRVWVEDRIKGDHTKGARFVVMLPVIEP